MPHRVSVGVTWSTPLNLVYFHYADSRAGEIPEALLYGFEGVLETDLYARVNSRVQSGLYRRANGAGWTVTLGLEGRIPKCGRNRPIRIVGENIPRASSRDLAAPRGRGALPGKTQKASPGSLIYCGLRHS